jgi:hypothetical protein
MLWLALLAAFSPVLVDLVRHLASEPWTRYALVFAPLLAVCVATSGDRSKPSADGYLWLAVGVGAELFALVGNMARFGRPAFSLGVIGLCRASGVASTRVAALALWLTPVPYLIVLRFSPELETALLHVVGSAARVLGAELSIEGSHVLAPSGVLELYPSDGGLPLAALLSGLGWYASLRTGASPWASLRRAMVWGATALPIQTLAILVAVGALAAEMLPLSRLILDQLWVAVALTGVGWIELRLRADSTREAPDRGTAASAAAKPSRNQS